VAKKLKPEDFFDLSHFEHKALFENIENVWDAMKNIEAYVKNFLKTMYGYQYAIVERGAFVSSQRTVSIGGGTIIESGAYIKGPAIIGENTEIRSGAYIRENVVIGDNCVIGHASEIKNSIVLDGGKAPHFNYVGDSIIGRDANLGAGVKLSNLKVNWEAVKVQFDGEKIDTGLLKFGAIVGDGVEIGCNTVLNPGTLLGLECIVYPNASVNGYWPPRTILKLRQVIEAVERK
jgi:UDP-N-acetylglucosamine diphosphorylase / glucose-1-phosphate thymidylyltransferase / UDP-N-acetylgalactosamine diphosphorylase / glucosamine-1-phosphate N-acetyltransferase / galactosamine-1-phosphate N-acetyltransferase